MAQTFPYLPGLTWPVARSMGQFDTTKQVALSGKENRYANRTQARYQYTIDVEALDSNASRSSLVNNSQQTLAGFVMQCLGSALIFNFWDVDDNLATVQQFGAGDGVTLVFQLSRILGGWSDNVFSPLVSGSAVVVPGPNGGTVNAPFPEPEIFIGGVLQVSGYTVNPANGQVTFAIAPTLGASLTWTGNYYWPCNFDDDSIAMSKFMSGLWEAKSVKFTTRIF